MNYYRQQPYRVYPYNNAVPGRVIDDEPSKCGCTRAGIDDRIKVDSVRKSCDEENCDTCERKDICSMPIAMAYTPAQKYKDLYTCSQACKVGTIFKELNLVFKGVC